MAESKEGQAATRQDGDKHDDPQPMPATRVTVDEVKERIARGEPFVFVDTRNPIAWDQADTKLPGAIHILAGEVEKHLEEIPRDRAVITYCT